jgi:hypothetical protein
VTTAAAAGLQQQAFRLAASELGMASAAWLFVRETASLAQAAGVAALRDNLGRAWPVLDAVCAGWLAGEHEPCIDSSVLLPALHGTTRLVLVGYEAAWVDALLARLPADVRVGLVCHGDPLADWQRVLANHDGRVEALRLADFQAWAGPRTVLLTFVYGATADQVFVTPGWLRASGPDVRLQFRHLLGWRILGVPLEVYPRWLVAADRHTLTELQPET